MALYLNNQKFTIYLGGYALALASLPSIVNNLLISSDGLVLKDLDGLYLTFKEGN